MSLTNDVFYSCISATCYYIPFHAVVIMYFILTYTLLYYFLEYRENELYLVILNVLRTACDNYVDLCYNYFLKRFCQEFQSLIPSQVVKFKRCLCPMALFLEFYYFWMQPYISICSVALESWVTQKVSLVLTRIMPSSLILELILLDPHPNLDQTDSELYLLQVVAV